jgi:hypothetical protein
LLLCRFHHHRFHEGGWKVVAGPDGFEFHAPDGRRITENATAVAGDSRAVTKHQRSATDGRCRWGGERLDLDMALTALFSRTHPSPSGRSPPDNADALDYRRVVVRCIMLAAATGTYIGSGDGVESGPFVSRIVVARLPNGGVSIDYEASSREQGLQHVEHSLLTQGPDQRDQLFIAHSESSSVTAMIETAPGSGRFEPPELVGPYDMAVVIDISGYGVARFPGSATGVD